MKSKTLSSRQTTVLFALLVITVLAGKFFVDEIKRHRELNSQLLSVTRKRCELWEQDKNARRRADVVRESAADLRNHEKSIPLADGYVHVSRLMMQAVPRISLTIDPPETSQDFVSAPEYCSGLFRVRGSGRLDDAIAILQKIDRDLPFARVQDLQIVFTDPKELKVDFGFSLLTVMRLSEEFAALEPATKAE